MREPGTGFLSFSATQHRDGRTDAALFLEYGVRPRLTLGLKVDADMAKGAFAGGTLQLFLRKPIGSTDRTHKLAYEVGLGTHLGDGSVPLVRTAISYGRGFKVRDRYGWLAVDGAVEWALGEAADIFKLDATAGLALGDRTKAMVQVFVSSIGNDRHITLSPSLIWQPKPERPSYQFGVEMKTGGGIALKLGLWKQF